MAQDTGRIRHELQGQVRGMERMPAEGWAAVEIQNVPGVGLMSANGRFFVLNATIVDVWSGKKLETMEDIREAAGHLNLAQLGLKVSDLAPISFGTGERRVTVFADPLCPPCLELWSKLPELANDYVFDILLVPMNGNGERLVRTYACAADRQAVVTAVLAGTREPGLREGMGCDMASVQKRLIATEMLGIRDVPTLIADDGRVMRGLNKPLGPWLAGTPR